MTTVPERPKKSIIKIALTASAGAAIEWYDFFLYGTAAALVFPKLFFPADLPPFVAQIAAFSTFAIGFIARPFGGMLFGHFGDIAGRKRALAVALLIMGLATTSVGLLPSYAKAGIFAPLMLVALRFIQGLAIGGQWGGAVLMAIESAPKNKQGYYGSFVQIGVPIGVVLSNIVFLISSSSVSPEVFQDWGWRIPFLLSIALVVVGIYVQLVLEEPEEFERVAAKADAKKPSWPLFALLKHHFVDVLLAGGAFMATNACFYIAITYSVAYGVHTAGVSNQVMLSGVMIGSVVMALALVTSGAISDKYGRLGIFMIGAVLTGACSFAIFPLIETTAALNIALAISAILACISLMYGPQAALFAELFPVEVRYSGVSLGYQIGSVFGGGFAPIIAAALFEEFHSSTAIAIYLAAICLITFICTVCLSVRARRQKIGEQVPA